MSPTSLRSRSQRLTEQAPLKLALVDADGKKTFYEVNRSPFRIGRLPGCEVTLRDSRISRKHAQILVEGSACFIEDCGSLHGLFVNGDKVERRKLDQGDRIEFGVKDSYHLIVGEEQEPAALIRKAAEMPHAKDGPTGELGRLSAVLAVARALQSSLALDDVLTAAVDAALAVTDCERGFLMLTGKTGELEVRVARNQYSKSLPEDELRVPRGLIEKALLGRRDLLSMSFDPSPTGTDGEAAGKTFQELQLRRAVCVPLVKIRIGQEHETSMLSLKQNTLGMLYMDSKRDQEDLSIGNRELLQTLAIEISTVLENARLLEEEREKKGLEQQLAIAHDIQLSMLPAILPKEGWLVATGHSEACYQVGGDYFDVTSYENDHWGFVLADVSGKGVSAALLASLIQGAFFSAFNLEAHLSETISRINRYVCERAKNARFATVFYGLINREGLTKWVNAGHCPALLVRAEGEVELLEANTVPLGLFAESEFPVAESRLTAGDKLVVYSDGVSEAKNWSGERFGEKRLQGVLTANAALPSDELYEKLRHELSVFTSGADQDDDVTLLVLGYQG